MTSSEPRRVGVVGTGLIGSSVAMAAQRAGDSVRAFDLDPGALELAAGRAGVQPAASLEECAAGSDIVFVCTPIDAIPRAVAASLASEAALVTDVGSVKANVLVEVEAQVGSRDRSRFVGGHPMGGSERAGPEAASASLIEGVAWILTPAPWTDPESVDSVEAYVARLGAHPVRMDAARHDGVVALVSHLPQVVSSALMYMLGDGDALDREALSLAGSGLRDVTRLAGSDPVLWTAILGANREAVVDAIDRFVERLMALRDDVASGREDRIREVLADAQRARGALGAKPRVSAGVAVLQIPVPDRPGVLAELTAALGEGEVNIEDLQIVHSPWGPSGVIHLTVLADRASAAVDVISRRGFRAIRVA